MNAIIYDWSSAVCKIKLDVLYSVVKTDTYPILVNPDGVFHIYRLVAFGPASLEIKKSGERFYFKYSFAEGVNIHSVSKKIVESIGFPDTVLRSSSGLRL